MNKVISAAVVAVALFSTSAWAEMVNINKASAEQIKTNLDGIGDKKAEAIIAYRTEHGAFKTIEEIKDVKGIGDGIFEKIKADLSLDSGIGDMAATPDASKEPSSQTAAAPDKAAEPAKAAATPEKAADAPAEDAKAEEKTDKVDKKAAADTLDAGKKDKS